MIVNRELTFSDLSASASEVLRLAAEKSRQLDRAWDPAKGAPVFTVRGKYATRGWTEWTEGFQYGCMILAGHATGDDELLELGRERTISRMLKHVTHIGVHDHGFNNLSTYGNLLRILDEERRSEDGWERRSYENAIAVSGAVQASRWAETSCGLGYIYSFNGPQSLFVDTMRSLRILAAAHQLRHALHGENDVVHNLLGRAIRHGLATSKYIVFHGDSDHTYDVRGRTAHEGLFNPKDGNFRARSTQQGYSPFSTWTRGLAWAMLGFSEQLEFFAETAASEFRAAGFSKKEVTSEFRRAAIDTCDHYLDGVSTSDGLAYWDDGAPNLHRMGEWRERPAEPENPWEPVDASAAAIAAQGLIRLGKVLGERKGARYLQAGLTVAETLFHSPYLAMDDKHQGLLLHSVYHWPNHWDHVPKGSTIPHGESCLWGDYHLVELAYLIERMAGGGPYPTFFRVGRADAS